MWNEPGQSGAGDDPVLVVRSPAERRGAGRGRRGAALGVADPPRTVGPAPQPSRRPARLLSIGILAASLAHVQGPFVDHPVAGSLLGGLCGAALLDILRRWRARRPRAIRLLDGAIRAIHEDEDPRRVAERLRGLKGGPQLRVAVRCLEEAGRSRRLELGLRREAVRWLQMAREELEREART